MKEKYNVSWNEIYERLDRTYSHLGNSTIYGVPKGGMILAGFLAAYDQHLVLAANPTNADVIVDDIADTGTTRAYYEKKFPDTEFIPLFDRQKEDLQNKWIVFPWEADHPAGEESVQDNITRMLQYIGEDPEREGLRDTPNRIVKSWKELYSGYDRSPQEVLTVFEEPDGYDQIILLKDIELFSMCEHHMLPFFGKAHVAYIPDGKVIGISKLARLVNIYTRRLQIQERIGQQVTQALTEILKPAAAACIIEAEHLCMKMRGVQKQNSVMTTSSVRGKFKTSSTAKSELMNLIYQG